MAIVKEFPVKCLDNLVTNIRRNNTGLSRGFLQNVHVQMSQNKKLNQIFDEVQQIRSLIDLIVQNIEVVKQLQNDVLSHTNRNIQEELESRVYTISQTACSVQRMLREMGKNVIHTDDVNINSAQNSPTYERIKVLQYKTMFKMYTEIMEDYNEALIRYYNKRSSLLHQQRALIQKNIPSEEFNEMLDSEETCLFVDNILLNTKIAKQQLLDIQSRHSEIKKLEKSIVEVRDMFSEMAFLIEKQGEQIDSVEYFAGKATNNIDCGRTDLNRAEKRKGKNRKRKIKILIIVIIVIIILLFITSVFERIF